MGSRLPDPGSGFEAIWQTLWRGQDAERVPSVLDLARLSARWLWSLTWRGVAWSLYLAFLLELRCMSDPPLPDFMPVFKNLLSVVLCVFGISLLFGGWRLPRDGGVSRK